MFPVCLQQVLILFAEIWQECCPIMWQKSCVEKFLFLASLESNQYLSNGVMRV